MHYQRVRRTGDPGPVDELYGRNNGGSCSVDGCKYKAITKRLCKLHYERTRTGKIGPVGQLIGERGLGSVDENGYRRIVVNGKLRREHRVVMEDLLGRPLLPDENIHHKNGNRETIVLRI